MSQCLNPVRAENSAARLSTSHSQGVLANLFSSSRVKYSLRDSYSCMPLILADKSIVKYPSMNACLSAALKIEKYVEAVFRDIVPFLLPPQGADNKKNLKSSANLLSICEKIAYLQQTFSTKHVLVPSLFELKGNYYGVAYLLPYQST